MVLCPCRSGQWLLLWLQADCMRAVVDGEEVAPPVADDAAAVRQGRLGASAQVSSSKIITSKMNLSLSYLLHTLGRSDHNICDVHSAIFPNSIECQRVHTASAGHRLTASRQSIWMPLSPTWSKARARARASRWMRSADALCLLSLDLRTSA